MGKRKKINDETSTFKPKISSASRKIAARRLESLNTGGLPHFMLHTKNSYREPLAPIPVNQSLVSTDVQRDLIVANDKASDFSLASKSDKSFKDKLDSVSNPDTHRSHNMSGKNDGVLDDNIFTFKPKVSSASAKIVENLGTDFMARQQQHIERQRRNVSFSISMIYI